MNARVLERCHVVTGGPGSGKTTLLSRLADLGYDLVELPRCSPDDRAAFFLGHVVTA